MPGNLNFILANLVLVCMVASLNSTHPDPADGIPDTPEGKAFLLGLFNLALGPVSDVDVDQRRDSSRIDYWLEYAPGR